MTFASLTKGKYSAQSSYNPLFQFFIYSNLHLIYLFLTVNWDGYINLKGWQILGFLGRPYSYRTTETTLFTKKKKRQKLLCFPVFPSLYVFNQ